MNGNTLLIVKNQGQPSNWSHFYNGSTESIHVSRFSVSIEFGEFQIEKYNAGVLEKITYSDITIRDDSSGVTGTPVAPTSPVDLANILEGLGYPAYSSSQLGNQNLESVLGFGDRPFEYVLLNDGDTYNIQYSQRSKRLLFDFSGSGTATIVFPYDANMTNCPEYHISLVEGNGSSINNKLVFDVADPSMFIFGKLTQESYTNSATYFKYLSPSVIHGVHLGQGVNSVYNPTASPLSASDLDTAYPTAIIGFEVICDNIPTTYKKSDSAWVELKTFNVT